MRLKKPLMTIFWRVMQTGPFLNVLFWGAALAGIFWPILGDRVGGPLYLFLTGLGIPPERVASVGIVLLFVLALAGILTFGFIYDRVFALWKEQAVVAYERNPYMRERLYPKEVVLMRLQLETLTAIAGRTRSVERMERWIAREMKDPGLARAVRDLEDGLRL